MKATWRTYKDKNTGYTIVEVCSGEYKLNASITPYKAKRISEKEFNRLVKSLQEALELYEA